MNEQSASTIVQNLTARFASVPGVRVSYDSRTSQVLVFAPPAVQEQVTAALKADGARASSGGRVAAENQDESEATAAQRGPKVIPLKNLSPQEFETAISTVFGHTLQPTFERNGQWARYALETRAGKVTLIVDRTAKQVALEGPVKLADAWGHVVEAIDSRPPQAGEDTRIVPLVTAKDADVAKAISILRNTGSNSTGSAIAGGNNSAERMLKLIFQKHEQNQAAPDQFAQANNNDDQNRNDQNPAQPGGQPMPPGGAPNPPGTVTVNPGESGGALIGPVQIEFLEGLDMIVIRGNPRDVERVTQIINDIERLSTETQPYIEFYLLKNVGADAITGVVQTLYDQVYGPRQGRISITPIYKPNSLLVIGSKDAVKTVLDLVQKLDQPVGPSTMFQSFPLKHASATAAQDTINQYFLGRFGGLTGRPSVVADYRSNTLIVQASPRDMQEVAALLKEIDRPTSAAVNEMRIFPLKNSTADDLAPILQAALTGQQVQGGRGQQGNQQNGNPFQNQGGGFGNQGGGGGGFGGAGGGAGGAGGGGFGGAGGGGAGAGGAGAGGANAGNAATQRNALSAQQRSTMLQFVTGSGELEQSIRSGLLTDVHVTADPRANTLIVSAPSESMGLIGALISQLDSMPSAESQIKVFQIKNGDAVAMIQMLDTLFGGRTPTTGAGGALANAVIQAENLEGESLLVPIRFSADQRTNSIIASGSAQDLAVVEAIIYRLDDINIRERTSTIYRLKNVQAAEVASSITQFLTYERQIQLAYQPAGTVNPFQQIDQEVVVVPEPASNSLIVSATPRFFDEIKKLIEEIDARPPMVMIQVLIGEVTLDNTNEFGVELGLQDSVLFDRSLLGDLVTLTNSTVNNSTTTSTTQSIVGASNTPGFNFNNTSIPLPNSGSDKSLATSSSIASQGLSNLGVGRTNSSLGFGGFVFSASSENLSVLLRALTACHRLDVLSRPQIMALDNQTAFVQVGQRVPRITASTVTVAGTTNSVTLDNVGIILYVQPRITPDDKVVMFIDAEKSELGPIDQGIPISINATGDVIKSPIYNTDLAETTVLAGDAQTIVLGGLLTSKKEQFHNRVPYLSNLPLIGNLFRFDSTTQQRTELLIIMTPHIVRNEKQADVIKQQEAARMSWCLGDVIKMHGESGLRGRKDEFGDNETVTVYPDLNADGSVKPVPNMEELAPAATKTPKISPQPTPAIPPQNYGPLSPADSALPPPNTPVIPPPNATLGFPPPNSTMPPLPP